jgi:hypothetical protein
MKFKLASAYHQGCVAAENRIGHEAVHGKAGGFLQRFIQFIPVQIDFRIFACFGARLCYA